MLERSWIGSSRKMEQCLIGTLGDVLHSLMLLFHVVDMDLFVEIVVVCFDVLELVVSPFGLLGELCNQAQLFLEDSFHVVDLV